MSFLHPLFLWLLLIVPILVGFYFYRRKKHYSSISFSLPLNTISSLKSKLFVLLFFLRTMAIILIIIALARPRKIDSLKKTTIDVIDILLVLDISSSMLADDFYPSRLEVVKNTAKQFVSLRKGDRIGIVVFAG